MDTGRTFKKILVTGGAGFIGSNFIRFAMKCDKIKKDLGWMPSVEFKDGIDITVTFF